MIQRTTNPPTGPRLGSSSTRSRGGGIQKRRTGPVRVDKDGDLLMDAVDKSKAGKGRLGAPGAPRGPAAARGGRGNARGSLTSQRAQSAILRGLGTDQATVLESRVSKGTDRTTLRVDGLKESKASANSDGGLSSLLGFLERKANGLDAKSKRTIKIKKSHKEGDSVIITASAEDAETILKLNNFVFAGSALSIQECNASSAPQSGKKGEKEELSDAARETQDKIRGILSTRYDTSLKLLNLSALGQDQALRDMGFFDGNNATVAKLFPVLMIVCDRLFTSAAEKREAIVSVTLADNELASVSLVSSLARTFPDLQNLDLSRNSFPDLHSLQPWRSKFRKLENLVLTGNPMEAQSPEYKNDIMRWYPKLQFLSGIQVRTPQEVVAAAEVARFPIPMKGPDFRDIGGVGEGFIRQFITLYDTDRAALLASFYDSESVFSMSLNTSAPHADRAVPPWTAYTKHSRNLTKITHAPTKLARRYRGAQAIKEVWTSLPATRHPDLATETAKYLVDCHALPGLPDPSGQNPGGVDGLTLTIHSEFEEENKTVLDKTLRSFSRTFILGPGAPGGPQIRVISDVMVLRAWAPLAQPSGSANPAGDMEAKKQQEEMTGKLMEMTRMTPEYAHLCLNETGWNLEQAFAAFNANKANLPANAFIANGSAAGQML